MTSLASRESGPRYKSGFSFSVHSSLIRNRASLPLRVQVSSDQVPRRAAQHAAVAAALSIGLSPAAVVVRNTHFMPISFAKSLHGERDLVVCTYCTMSCCCSRVNPIHFSESASACSAGSEEHADVGSLSLPPIAVAIQIEMELGLQNTNLQKRKQ